ncbi:Glyoxylate/hydroxypyruvate reductase A [Raoultella terrigena]|uniref:Glyoxylate/hydroxypyruvate reductase A n=1 Tax=Raoultella terrigena TaxID=577 RepID=A0A4U9DDC8_RAOTE|nr:Glyoxylate/hydroxypyruvate reductase A [Raoultella terrigena]
MLPLSIPLFRLEDTGMGLQMQEYAVSQVLHWFRRFDDYHALKQQARWQPLDEYRREDFTIGIMGAGVLGAKVAQGLQAGAFRYVAGAAAARRGRRCKALPGGRAE